MTENEKTKINKVSQEVSNSRITMLVEKIDKKFNRPDITKHHLWQAIQNAIDPKLMISNLAEALRISAQETEKLLDENGFADKVALSKMTQVDQSSSETEEYILAESFQSPYSYKNLFAVEFNPPLNSRITLQSSLKNAISYLFQNISTTIKSDAFVDLYRKDVKKYYEEFIDTDAKKIDQYVNRHFPGTALKYIVNAGIGANEQFNHFVAYLNNQNPDKRVEWLMISSPRYLYNLPPDATIENTLFMEFSRSGKTEETVKIHEYTPRNAKRIVFANRGPLREIGKRDDNLVLDLPDQVSGRFGRNKTPILLAPMYIAGMDTKQYWNYIVDAIEQFDITSITSLPGLIAQFISVYQQRNSINHIYLGCNDDVLMTSANEFIQFWNEGVNKDGNDISMSNYFGLLRDSHANIEGILANHDTKMGIFLFHNKNTPDNLPVLTNLNIDPITEEHNGLQFGDEENILAEANFLRFSEVMPAIKITVNDAFTLEHSAILGQLWSDITYCYSKMVNVDPGSNPEVKFVRDRSAKLLAQNAKRKRNDY